MPTTISKKALRKLVKEQAKRAQDARTAAGETLPSHDSADDDDPNQNFWSDGENADEYPNNISYPTHMQHA